MGWINVCIHGKERGGLRFDDAGTFLMQSLASDTDVLLVFKSVCMLSWGYLTTQPQKWREWMVVVYLVYFLYHSPVPKALTVDGGKG